MRFFRSAEPAETAELDRPTAARADTARADAAQPDASQPDNTRLDMREFVRREFAPSRRQPDYDSAPSAPGNLEDLMQRVSGSSLQYIDDVIRELQILRRKLCAESERVQREIIEYASLSQAAMQSTRIITESLAHWKKPDHPGAA
jgi:hypothetical protein